MLRVMLNIALLLAALGLVIGNWALLPDRTRPNYEFLPDMAHAPRYNAFAPNPEFADGQTLQLPPPGSIARGSMPLHYGPTPQDALRAGEELHSPVDGNNAQAQERGAVVFATYCAACHGPRATGDGTVTQRGFPSPPSLLLAHALNMKDGQVFHVLTYGQGNMPSYAGQVSRQDRWNVIAYLRTLQNQAPPAAPAPILWPRRKRIKMTASDTAQPVTPSSPAARATAGAAKVLPAAAQAPAASSPADPARVREGAKVFSENCAMCHGADATGAGGDGPPSLVSAHAASLDDQELFATISKGRGGMPAWAGQLSEQQRRDVIAHLRTLQGHGGAPLRRAGQDEHEGQKHLQRARENEHSRGGRP